MFFDNIIQDIYYYLIISEWGDFFYSFFLSSLFIIPSFFLLDKILYYLVSKYSTINIYLDWDKIIKEVKEKNNKQLKNINNFIRIEKKEKFHKNFLLNNFSDYAIKHPLLIITLIFLINVLFFIYIFHEILQNNIPTLYVTFIVFLNLFLIGIRSSL